MKAAAPPLGKLPRHLAIIMDGNGRWAEARQLPRTRGHEEGAHSVRAIVTAARELGIEVLTLYSFSTENWKRPADEVARLMGLAAEYLQSERKQILENGIRLRVLGDVDRLPAFVRLPLRALVDESRENRGMILCLALSYGARDEIVRATKKLLDDAKAGRLQPRDLDEDRFALALDTHGLPDVDLVIRTAGEMRVSNFLLWQIAYAEILVTDTAWPDFRRPQLEDALATYAGRERRLGKTGAQLRENAKDTTS